MCEKQTPILAKIPNRLPYAGLIRVFNVLMDVGESQEEELWAVFPKHIFLSTFNSDVISHLQKSGRNSTENSVSLARSVTDILPQLLYHSFSLSLSLSLCIHIYVCTYHVYFILFLNCVLHSCKVQT